MGGKKKTKWRRLPLEELTKDCSESSQSRRNSDDNNYEEKKIERNERNPEDVETSQQMNTEYYEHLNVWYPTHYVIYNPAELPVYSNYMMPSDTNCYYYPGSEMNSSTEYGPTTYQEYIPQAKDTVYLLFPASALRAPQVSPYDWRFRRRRRRYGGYAEYAVIPEKESVESKTKENTDNNTVKERLNCSSNHFKTSENNKKYLKNQEEILQKSSFKSDVLKVRPKSEYKGGFRTKMGLSNNEKKETSSADSNKNNDTCSVHGKYSNKQFHNNTRRVTEEMRPVDNLVHDTLETNGNETQRDSSVYNMPSCTFNSNTESEHLGNKVSNEVPESECAKSTMKNHGKQPISEISSYENDSKNKEHISVSNIECNGSQNTSNNENRHLEQPNCNHEPLPDILNTINELPAEHKIPLFSKPEAKNDSAFCNIISIHKSCQNNDSGPFSKSVPHSSKSSSSFISFEKDNEDMAKQTNEYGSLHLKNSIYKLAYDESLHDHSRSPTPIDPESQMPSSLINYEINVYEAGSDDDAGSEDLEIIPHRYESESYLNKSKYLYENKLSLAVELLRTKEELPYDAQFKRITSDSDQETNKSETAMNDGQSSQIDSSFSNSVELKNKCKPSNSSNAVITNQGQLHSKQTVEMPKESSLTDSCEIADEVVINPQENTEEVKAGYRRFGIQLQHYFYPRSALNPLNCCIIM